MKTVLPYPSVHINPRVVGGLLPTLPVWELRRRLTQDATGHLWGLWRYVDDNRMYVYNVFRSTDPAFPPAGRGGVHLHHLAPILEAKRLRYMRADAP